MQLSVSTGKHGILQRATFLTFGDSLDHTADYPLADMVASANRWVQAVGLWIWRVSGTWEFDDSNYTTLPFATTNLVNNQQDYALPTTALALRRVEVRDANGIWSQLTQMDASEVGGALLEQGKIAGLPRHYDVVGNSLMLYPRPAAASVTLVGGLRMQVDRESLTFSVPASYITADPTEPGFAEPFHDIIPLGVSHDYLLGNDNDKATNILQQILLLRRDLEAFSGRRNVSKPTMITPTSIKRTKDFF